jgi:hypothetical protein
MTVLETSVPLHHTRNSGNVLEGNGLQPSGGSVDDGGQVG